MKHLRLVALVLAVSAAFAALAYAGKTAKGAAAAGDCCGAKATTASAACPATASCPAGSAQCTAAQRAACEKAAKGAKATTAANAGSGSCAMHGASTAAASGSCAMHGTSTAAAAGSCSMHGATTAAAAGNCASHASKGAMAAGTCSMQNGAGGKCDMAGMPASGCAVCSDAMACDDDVHNLNAHAQVVALRNGTMIVYTADTPENVRALQVALARHNEQTMNAFATNSDASLCSGCKTFRGAMASGKFSRELVNVKSGAQVLLTSTDRTIVRRIHDMTGAPASRTKS